MGNVYEKEGRFFTNHFNGQKEENGELATTKLPTLRFSYIIIKFANYRLSLFTNA